MFASDLTPRRFRAPLEATGLVAASCVAALVFTAAVMSLIGGA